jgi:hypothetical protein
MNPFKRYVSNLPASYKGQNNEDIRIKKYVSFSSINYLGQIFKTNKEYKRDPRTFSRPRKLQNRACELDSKPLCKQPDVSKGLSCQFIKQDKPASEEQGVFQRDLRPSKKYHRTWAWLLCVRESGR